MAFTKRGVDRLSALILIATALTLCAGWAIPLWQLDALRGAELDRASALALSQSRILRAHAEQGLDAAAVAFRSFDQEPDIPGIQPPSDAAATHILLRQLRDGSALFDGLGLIDAAGELWVSADRNHPAGVDLSDRDYFEAHRAIRSMDLRIDAPIVSRPRNIPAIPVSMRLDDARGNFAGVIAGRVRPAVLESLYRSAGADAAMLLLADGTPLICVANGQASGDAFAAAIQPAMDAAAEPEAAVDKAGWIVGFSRSARYSVVVAVGFERNGLLAEWRKTRLALLTLAAIRTLVVACMAGLLLWWLRRQRRLSMALAAARDAADEARLSAEAANRSKSEFLAHMSHELRTPLNAVIGFSEMMVSERMGPVGNPRYREYAHIVNASSGHLLAVINSILDLAKVDAGKWDLQPEPVSLHGLARDLRNLTVGRAEASNVSLSIDLGEDMPRVESDRRLLLQILVNLATNAIKFTPAGGRIDVAAAVLEEGVAIRVVDTGFGMSAEELAALREPFRRVDGQGRRRQETGLGLPLSLRFADLIGARLEIASERGKGTQAVLYLPWHMELPHRD
ncbi:MAG: ATP-binding protein [Alphaproteobacteria bacterium]